MATLTWDGNNGNGSNVVWSAWNNWNPTAVPHNGDTLIFSGTRKLSNVNNYSGLSIQNVIIRTNGFRIDGNAINLGSGGIHFVGGNVSNWGIPLGISHAETPIEVYGSRTFYLNDVIYGGGGVAKHGIGTAVLGASNSFSGGTKIYAGVLYLANSNALHKSTLDYNNNGGVVSFGSLTTAALGGLTGNQNLSLNNASGNALALTVGGNGQDTTYGGVLGGSGRLTKTGSGMLTLTGVHTYTGTTTVQAGKLAMGGSLAASTVTVTGGVLTGNGSVRSLSLMGGTVSPGNGIGTFTVSSGAFLDQGRLEISLNDGVTVDQLRVLGGSVRLGANLVVSAGANFQSRPNQVYALVNNAGTGALTGAFAGIADGQVITVNGHQFIVRYNYDFGGDGNANDVVLVATEASPTALADEYFVDEDHALVVAAPGVLANDTNPSGDPLTLSLVQNPAHGTVTLAADGGFVYKPEANFDGLDSMIYQIADDQGRVSRATVKFNVTAVNDLPVIGANAFQTVQKVVMRGTLNASDSDSPLLTYSLVSGPAAGQVSLNSNGSFTYLQNPNSRATNVSFTFAVSDGKATVQGTATISILAWNGKGIRPDVLSWMLAHNPGLKANFLKTERPDKVVLLPDGRSTQIYKLDQFLDVNFKLDFKSRQKGHVNFVERQEDHLRKLMALPEFYYWIKQHSNTYRIAGKGKVTSEQAYNYFRNINRTIFVTASDRVKAPVGGGNGINAPSWAVWNQMNLFFHEACHVIGIGHNSGGLSGPLAGKLRNWDRQERWNYATIDLNKLDVPVK